MLSFALLVASFFAVDVTTANPRIGGAFIQLDGCNKDWTRATWEAELARMRAAKLDLIIVQYLEARASDDPATSEQYVSEPGGDPDPLKRCDILSVAA